MIKTTLSRGRLLLLAMLLICTGWVAADDEKDAPRALLLLSYHPSFPTSDLIIQGAREVLLPAGVELDIEFMDSKRLLDRRSSELYRDWLAYRLQHRSPYDVVISADDNALELVMAARKQLFPSVPLVFLGVNNVERALSLNRDPNVTGVVEAVSMAETLNLMQQLQFERRRVHVVVDGTPSGQSDWRSLKYIASERSDLVLQALSLKELSWLELTQRLQQLGDEDSLMLLSAYRDREGVSKEFTESLALIRKHSAVPIYHFWRHGMGDGVLGGIVVSHDEQARRAAQMALEILNGQSPGDIPVLASSPNVPMFDLDELQRFGLSADDLPAEAVLLNRQVGIYERYPVLVNATFGAMLVLCIVIALLLHLLALRRESARELDQERNLLRALIDSIPDLVFVKSEQGRYAACNKAFEQFVGRREAELLGLKVEDALPEAQSQIYHEHDNAAMAKGASVRRELWVRNAQGDRVLLDALKSPYFRRDGELAGVIGVCRDVTNEHSNQARLQQAAKVFEAASEGIIVTDAMANIIAVNPAFEAITGYSEAEVLGENPRILSSQRHDQAFYNELWRALRNTGHWRGEMWNRSKSGTVFPEWLSINAIRDPAGNICNYVAVFTDISAKKASEERLYYLAHHDALTGLPNRLQASTRLEHTLQREKRAGGRAAVLFIDLDHFKHINDSLGHQIGDAVLCEAARRLQSCAREEDTVARLGGDEFVVVMGSAHERADVERVANKILGVLRPGFVVDGQHLYVSASIGISLYPDDGDEANKLIRNADAAMYKAKGRGRDAFEFYTSELTDVARNRVRLESDLRRALIDNELFLEYQPQVDLRSGRLVGVEALVRWQHPELGRLAPDRFVPMAEDSGLIVPLSDWVLAEACDQMARWQAEKLPVPRMAVNLSSKEIHRDDLVLRVQQALSANCCDPRWLELEVTENFALHDIEVATERLDRLREMGVHITIDDFGAGYSSLAHLKRLPVSQLKIDRSFIRDLIDDPNDAAIASAVISLGNTLGMKILAEGVESHGQAEVIASLGCHTAQGFLYAKPLGASDLAEFARGRDQGWPPPDVADWQI